MADYLIQPSFAGGELSPQLNARVDFDRFHIGLSLAKNVFVDYRGGVTSRAGTRLVARAGTQESGKPPRLIRFQFSVLQTYVLEFGNAYMRVLKNGGIVAPGGTPFVLTTPWGSEHLALLKYAQSNDVMTITHPDFPPYDLIRLADDNWVLQEVRFRALVPPPAITGVTAKVGTPGSEPQNQFYDYVVTAVGFDGVESQQSVNAYVNAYSFDRVQQTITISITNVANAAYYNFYKARPTLITTGDDRPVSAPIYGYVGSSEGLVFVDTNIIPDFSRTPPKHREPFSTNSFLKISVAAPGNNYSPGTYLQITDPTGQGARPNLIYNGKAIVGVQLLDAGFHYTNPTIQAIDPTGEGSGAAFGYQLGPAAGTFPGVVTYYQQRKVYGASHNQPSTYWASRPGQFDNMDETSPPVDSDATTFTLAALEQNPIKYMIPMQNGLVILTGGAAWLVSGGGQNEAFGPNSVRQTPQVYDGCADVQPLVMGYNILYVQEKGYVVKDLKYDFLSSTYTGEDRTFLSTHLFEGTQIKEWCWAEQPQRLVWAVMTDGRLLSMTYLPDQKIFGWTQHDTNGFVESIASCPEGDEDFVYLVVQRPSGRFVERMESRRNWATTKDAWALDCALKYEGAPTSSVSGLGDNAGETLAVVADGVYVGNRVVGSDGSLFLDQPASTVLVGWGFNPQIRTMYLDTQTKPTVQGRRKFTPRATLRLIDSRGMLVGRDINKTDPVKDDLVDPSALFTGDLVAQLNGGWEEHGQVCVLGNTGMPLSLTAIIPEVAVGDSGG